MPMPENNSPLRILCLDIEGGHGGSSRSLFALLRHIDQKGLELEVVCRRDSMLVERYRNLDILCQIMPSLPKVSSLAQFSRNLIVYGRFVRDLLRGRRAMIELADAINDRFDLVHFNHEAYFLLARWLRRRTKVPFVMHLRTNLQNTLFARWQERLIGATVDHLVFITEFEGKTFHRLGGRGEGTVIHNVAETPDIAVKPLSIFNGDERFKVFCLANYSWDKGLDRLIDVALALADAHSHRERHDMGPLAGCVVVD